ncbi:MAG TPA: nucleotidyl transferase AbiEii/AbiGii toxin family protein [Ignavibacteria bacterium]|nr:nucleotidyl transferase AbiEii/AbiGii toxin family protein [Ignavibacteria bacterium]
MILESTFTKEWILSVKTQKSYRKINPEILEKMIYAFYLLEALQKEKLDFIFKGGTCLALLFDKPKRFSVDIDILTQQEKNNIEKILDSIIVNFNFKRYELDERRSYKEEGIPKAHYELFYDSQIINEESSIMLDILFDENFYPVTVKSKIKSSFLETDNEPTIVIIPNINNMTGDKLTAFAPNTSGYIYGKRMELQIIKQLFDLGFLIDEIDNFEEIFETYVSKKARLDFHFNNIWGDNEILDDIINTSLLLSKRGKNLAADEVTKYEELNTGIKRLETFLIKRPFYIDLAIESAAKVALCAAKIKSKDLKPIEKFEKGMELKSFLIKDKNYLFLNDLLRNGTLALFYFHQMVKVLNG